MLIRETKIVMLPLHRGLSIADEHDSIGYMFITFEGLDFSGKTTQATLLVEKLRSLPSAKGEKNTTVHFIREPGGTRISERIREVLLDKDNLELTEVSELLLFSASRAQMVKEFVLPALQQGEIVVCDRYFDSTTAYQGYGRGIDLETVHTINRLATYNTNPDLTILVDIPVDEIERRKVHAGMTFDRMEASGREFYERARKGYLALAAADTMRWYLVDGLAPVESIARTIWMKVEQKLIINKSIV